MGCSPFLCGRSTILTPCLKKVKNSMTQEQLNEIWRRHEAGEDIGSDSRAHTDADDNDRIHKDGNDWERPAGKDIWQPVPPLRGNL